LSREIFDFAQVSIDAVRDDAEHNFLNTIGTNFDLSGEEVRLISAARKVLHKSPEFKAFLKRTQGRSK